ncbi:MAG: hypothetical protein M0Q53_09425 [Prolixibacteraceae bacterium]|jgi:hypothetical protein|nr:hypothetical protein [Prolixibacteraceae bacterium]
MKRLRYVNSFLVFVSILLFFSSCVEKKGDKTKNTLADTGNMLIGWASENITPDSPVLISGQFHARVSEGVMDPVTVTALAIESGTGPSSEKAIMISCDLAGINNDLLVAVRESLMKSLPEIKPEQIIISATHTHTAPLCSAATDSKSAYGVDLEVMAPSDYQKFVTDCIAKAAGQAWKNRKPGGISFGLGHAVTGHNRLAVDHSGKSVMYGKTNTPDFSHLEGYEDHAVNLIYTWDKKSKLTGVVINVACPSQVTELFYRISADYWHDTRVEVRKRVGKDVYIFAQCSAAGDQSPHVILGAKAEERMQKLMGVDSSEIGTYNMGRRKQIAIRIADAVTSVLPYMKDNIDWDPKFAHRMEKVELSRRLIDIEDVKSSLEESEVWKVKYEEMLLAIKENPEIMKKPRWCTDITISYSMMKRGQNVRDRYELEKRQPKMPVEIHVIRIGNIAIATNPFELYLDYGMRIKGPSPAIQTFLVQLTGSGTYLPPKRSAAGGSYGAVPASTLIGPEGGQEFVEKTLDLINTLW